MVYATNFLSFFFLVGALCLDTATLGLFQQPYTAFTAAAFCQLLLKKESFYLGLFASFLLTAYALVAYQNVPLFVLFLCIEATASFLIKSLVRITPFLQFLFSTLFLIALVLLAEYQALTYLPFIPFFIYRIGTTLLGYSLAISLKRSILKNVLR